MTANERAARRAGRWCMAANDRCVSACPVASVDNFGNPYPGCPRFRLKSLEELGLSNGNVNRRAEKTR